MTAFTRGKPIATKVPTIVVDGTLQEGTHRFTLVVQDDTGVRSEVAEAVVLVGGIVPPIEREVVVTPPLEREVVAPPKRLIIKPSPFPKPGPVIKPIKP